MTHEIRFFLCVWKGDPKPGAVPDGGALECLYVQAGDSVAAVQCAIDHHYDRMRWQVAQQVKGPAAVIVRIAVDRVNATGGTSETYGRDVELAAGPAAVLDLLDRTYLRHRFHLARFAALEAV